MKPIESLIPEVGRPDEAGLRALDGEVLARFVIDAGNPWWRRRPCAIALRGRVPESLVAALIERACDSADVPGVRISLLEILSDRDELLPWLHTLNDDQRAGLYEAILKARAHLGDLTAAGELATLASDPSEREIGLISLMRFVDRYGLEPIVAAIGGVGLEDRVFQVRHGGDFLAAFADADVGVAHEACDLAATSGVPDDEQLLDHVITAPTTEARLWAAYALHRRGRDVRDLWDAIDRPRVEIARLDEALRLAILREYPGITGTDPRWLVERACVELPARPDEADQLVRAAAALADGGFAPGPASFAGELEGRSTYHTFELGDGGGAIAVSTLGAYVTGDDASPARPVLERAGFRWIDAAIGRIRVEGLWVSHLGDLGPLDVRRLVFFWSD